MTYGDAIWKKQQEADKIYADCEALRDVADLDEKENWNRLRQLLQYVDSEFQKLGDKAYKSGRGEIKLKGNY